MLSAYNQQGTFVMAWEVTWEQEPFFCPACEKQVIVKKGSYKIHHFAHLPGSDCSYGTGESEEHRQVKYQIYEALHQHPSVTKLIAERFLKEVRPDISFCWQGKDYVAIELQISNISPVEIARRTSLYTDKKIAVLWTIPYRHENMSCLIPYRTLLRERYLHALYDETVYYWLAGETLYPVHFEPYSTIVGIRWANNGDVSSSSVEGIYRFSPVFRNLDPGEVVRITDLKQVWCPARQISNFALPKARLWMLPRNEIESNRTDDI